MGQKTGTRKTTPARPTLPAGTPVTVDGRSGTIALVRRRKWAKRYGVAFPGEAGLTLVRWGEFSAGGAE